MIRPPADFNPYPWQLEAAKRSAAGLGLTCAADPGAGKTAAGSLAWIATDARRILVIAPAGRVAAQWAAHAKAWGADVVRVCGGPGEGGESLGMAIAQTLGGNAQGDGGGLVRVAVVPWSRLSRTVDATAILEALAALHAAGRPVDFLTVDEAHYAQSGAKSARAIVLLGGKPKGARTAVRGIRHWCKRSLALTGTPATSDPKKVYACLLLAALDRNPTLSAAMATPYTYEARYWGGRMEWNQAARIKLWTCEEDPTPDHAQLIRAGILRVSPADLAKQLPSHRRELWADLNAGPNPSPEGVAALHAWATAMELGEAKATPALEELANVRRAGTEARAGQIAEACAAWHGEAEAGRTLLVWCVYQDSAEALRTAIAEALGDVGHMVGMIHGGCSAHQRAAMLANAIEGTIRVLVVTMASTGTGVDGLQRSSNDQIVCELPWTPGEVVQAEGRIVRSGQTRPVRTVWIGAGVEGIMANALGKKAKRLEVMLSAADEAGATVVEAPASNRCEHCGENRYDVIGVDYWSAGRCPCRERATTPTPSEAPETVARTLADVEEEADAIAKDEAGEPTAASWGWARDRRNPTAWLLRADATGHDAWMGAEVVARSAAGKTARLILDKRCSYGEGWSLWSFTNPEPTAGERNQRTAGYLARRGEGRSVAPADDSANPIPNAYTAAADAAHAACCALSAADPDKAAVRNNVGWAAMDGTMGHRLAELPRDAWTVGVLRCAVAVLVRYSRTQAAHWWPVIKAAGMEPAPRGVETQ